MFSRSIVTLNIESNEVRYVVARGKRVLRWGSLPLAPGLVKQGLITDSAGLSSAINILFMEEKLPRSRVIASLSGQRSALRIFSLPKIKSNLLDEAIHHEAEREMPVSLEELYLSQHLLDAKDSEQRFFVIGVPRDILDTEVRTLGQAGIRPDIVNLKPLALARAVNREEALIIDLEPETFDLVVVVGGIPMIMRTVTSRSEGMILEDRVPQLTDELARTLEFYNSSHPEHPLGPTTPVFLTGLLADDTTACDLVKATIDNPIETLALPLKCPPNLPVSQYAVNIGLALRQASSRKTANPGTAPLQVVNPNVLPQRCGPQQISPGKILYPLIAMALIAHVFFMYQWKIGGEANIADIQDELISVNRQIDQMREVTITTAAAIDDAEAEADRLEEERESILAALATSNLSDSLQLVLDEIPEGVHITSIQQAAEQISLGGDADRESSVADYLLALERMGVFSTVYVAPLSGGDDDIPVTFSIIGDKVATR